MRRRVFAGLRTGKSESAWGTVPMVVLCFALLAPGLGFGQGFKRVSLPIPVEIEGRPTHCQLYLKVEMKDYNVDFEKFAAGPLDKVQTIFATGVNALRKNDVTKFASVWSSPDQMKGRSDLTIKMVDESPAAWLNLARSNFDFNHLTVVAEVLLGPQTVFVFDSTTSAGVHRYALYVGPDKKDQVRLSAVGSNTPLALMVLNSFVEARTSPDEYKPLTSLNLRYQYPIPLAGKVDAGDHPVFFEFDGTPMDFPLTDEKVKAPTPLLSFYRTATEAFDSSKYDVYAGDFTEQSQERLRPWLASRLKQEEDKLKQQKLKQGDQAPAARPTKPVAVSPAIVPHVKFVLNAEPVFLIFSAAGVGSGWKPSSLSYTYVLHEGSDYKLANFSYSNTLDDFLQDPLLFNKNILKPAPVKLGTAKPKPAAAVKVPAPAKH